MLHRTVLLLLLCSSYSIGVSAQQVQFRLTAKNTTPIATKSRDFTICADQLGTDGLDTIVGEIEIPDIPLPGDIFYVWTIAPVSPAIWLSPIEVRKYEPGVLTREDYDLRVNWTGGTLEIGWTAVLPPQIDSMYITDGYTDFPDNIQKVKVLPGGTKFVTNNPAFDRFKVLVWYNGKTTSVSETFIQTPALQFYPHPVRETLHFAASVTATEVRIFDVNGRIQFSTTGIQGELQIPTHELSPGTYILNVIDANGNVRTTPFVHY